MLYQTALMHKLHIEVTLMLLRKWGSPLCTVTPYLRLLSLVPKTLRRVGYIDTPSNIYESDSHYYADKICQPICSHQLVGLPGDYCAVSQSGLFLAHIHMNPKSQSQTSNRGGLSWRFGDFTAASVLLTGSTKGLCEGSLCLEVTLHLTGSVMLVNAQIDSLVKL